MGVLWTRPARVLVDGVDAGWRACGLWCSPRSTAPFGSLWTGALTAICP